MKRKLLVLFLALTIIVQGFVALPTFAANVDPYEPFAAASADSYFVGDEAHPLTLKANGRASNFRGGSWLCYSGLNFGESGADSIELTLISPETSAPKIIEVRLDSAQGELIAEVPITPSADWLSTATSNANLTRRIKGVQTIYLCTKEKTVDLETICFFGPRPETLRYNVYEEKSVFSDVTDKSLISALNVLVQLGIIEENESGEYKPELYTSRQEFAYSIFRMFKKQEFNKDGEPIQKKVQTRFEDVAADSYYSEAIAYLSDMGIMNGVSDTHFRPADYIQYVDAITVILRVLGFSETAELNGGYPNGYLKTARKEKLIGADVVPDAFLSREDMAYLLEKAIDADYLEGTAYTGDGYTEYSRVAGILNQTLGIKKGSGRIMGTCISMLTLPETNLGINEVLIGDNIYKAGNTDANGMLGFEVDFWYEEIDGKNVICAIIPQKDTEYTFLYSGRDEITKISDTEISYIKEGEEKENTLELNTETPIIYNGVAADKSVTQTVDYIDSFKGFMHILEGGSGNNLVVIEEYLDLEIESVDIFLKTIKFKDYPVVLNLASDTVIMTGLDGDKVELETLKTGDILTVYISDNDATGTRLVRAFVNGDTANGKITKYENGDYYINDEKAIFSNRYKGTFNLGIEREFKRNIYGDVIADDSVKGVPLVGLYFDYKFINDGFDNGVEVKIMDSTAKVSVYPVSKRIIIDGSQFENRADIATGKDTWSGFDEKVAETPIRYRLNSAGEVCMIDFPGDASEDENDKLIKLNGEEIELRLVNRTLTDWANGRFIYYCPDTALGFTFYGTEDREIWGAAGPINTIFTSVNLHLKGGAYSTTGSPNVADIVIHSERLVNTSPSAPIVFDSRSTMLDSDGNIIDTIICYNSSGMVEYIMDDITKALPVYRDVILKLEKGDLVRIKLAPGNYVRDAQVVMLEDRLRDRYSKPMLSKKTYVVRGSDMENKSTMLFGTVIEKNDQYMILDTTKEEFAEGETVVKTTETIPLGGSKVIEVYKNAVGEDVIKTGHTDTVISEGDKIFIYIASSAVSSIVLYE